MKYVLVTGAYGGMGYKTVKQLASKGFTVFALDKKVNTILEFTNVGVLLQAQKNQKENKKHHHIAFLLRR